MSKQKNDLSQRKSIRLPEYDYSRFGYYFVTICTQDRCELFGNIVDGKMVLNEYGKIVKTILLKLPQRYENIELDTHQIMPNHVHVIIAITVTVGMHHDASAIAHHDASAIRRPTQRGDKRALLPICIGYLKMNITKMIRNTRAQRDAPQRDAPQCVWQRNYWERVIRNNRELNRIRNYIINNPLKWDFDRNNPKNF